MKKNVNWLGIPYRIIPFKLLLIMKLIVFVICLTTLGALASSSYSQATKLSLSSKNTSIKQVLLEIENQSEFYFLYNNKLIDVEKKVNVDVKDKKILTILDLLF